MRLPKRNTFDKKKRLSFTHAYTNHAKDLKPNGLWYSCSNSWYRWIIEEGMTSFLYPYIHKIRLRPRVKTTINKNDCDGTKLLVIQDVRDFDTFNKRYRVVDGKHVYIDWSRVSKNYGGIEICPYLEERRGILWYSAWDVASGCIWDMRSIIQQTELVYEKHHGKYIAVSS
jgi:hypothetical protein